MSVLNDFSFALGTRSLLESVLSHSEPLFVTVHPISSVQLHSFPHEGRFVTPDYVRFATACQTN